MGPYGKLLAIGGAFSPERIILAYQNGIYPLSYEGQPLLWWTSDTYLILYLDKLHIATDVRKFIRNDNFSITADKAYYEVVNACSENRQGQTWLTKERKEAAFQLYEMGKAHSVEVWQNNELIGGLFGVVIGSCFYNESMFTRRDSGSKVAMTASALRLKELNFRTMDLGDWPTDNLLRYGSTQICREDYMKEMKKCHDESGFKGDWVDIFKDWDLKSAIKKHRHLKL
ncbi:leucyl/phenylalanyl-tRNA--protein transferase [Eubacteriaceae bacterium ES3]|nr:leucyl/phenylalanyl-tRNA--protein transferase [Eubacteriaceae bacterium ES3]